MYSERRIRNAADIIRRIAQREGVSEQQARKEIEIAMSHAQHNPDPAVQARWATFHYAGAEPTIEEFILWSANIVREQLQSND